jgi:outer membrane receptor protein involved in Fe transport
VSGRRGDPWRERKFGLQHAAIHPHGRQSEIKPEKSKTFSAGIVIEPTKSLTVSLDYFQIKLRDKIGTVAEQDPVRQLRQVQG